MLNMCELFRNGSVDVPKNVLRYHLEYQQVARIFGMRVCMLLLSFLFQHLSCDIERDFGLLVERRIFGKWNLCAEYQFFVCSNFMEGLCTGNNEKAVVLANALQQQGVTWKVQVETSNFPQYD